jgi:signal transduction histidine kinase
VGLEAALSDLLSPLEAAGIATELHVDPTGPGGSDELVYRVARESLRNVQSHAGAGRVRVDLTRPRADVTQLLVTDDGRGFAALERERREAEDHIGLLLLTDLVERAGGHLSFDSAPGRGTVVKLEVPDP